MTGAAVFAVIVSLGSVPAAPQHLEHHTVGDFLESARSGTERYRTRAAAVADGFRPLGPDAPAMGQHWVHPGRVLSSVFDPARPAGLTYMIVGGRPTLTGVIYVLPLDPGAQPPREPASADAWHFHNGDLSEEAVLSVHDPAHGRDAPGLRIAVLHAWVWAENPDGPFAPDNWSLPYTRLGLPPPDAAPPSAAKAVSLATAEGRTFFASRVRLATGRPVPDVERVLLAHGERIRALLPKPGAPGLAGADIRWLEESWHAVVSDLLAMAAAGDRERVRGMLDARAP